MMETSTESEAVTEEEPFWRWKRLVEMTSAEWESLCDGCGKCCLLKLEDPDTAEIAFTDVACKLLDLGTWRHVEIPASLDAAGGLVVPGAARVVSDWLRAGGTSVAWSLEGRVEGVAVWRARGRRIEAGER